MEVNQKKYLKNENLGQNSYQWNGIHSLTDFAQNLADFKRILEQLQTFGHLSRVCMMCY